ncbi:MAG: hypothetical protein HY261_04670 [Chloroflexi bacterium]|nr:hypothetical protein [Chloroflexota bacterium]
MQFVRMYTGLDSRSHFEDLPLPSHAPGETSPLSLPQFKAAILRRGIKSVDRWQNAPLRQYVITLAGRIEIETSDGEKRVFGPGDILLTEDVQGEGHRVRVIGEEERVALSLHLA